MMFCSCVQEFLYCYIECALNVNEHLPIPLFLSVLFEEEVIKSILTEVTITDYNHCSNNKIS